MVEKKEVRKVHYAGKDGLMLEIELREGRKAVEEITSKASKSATGGQNMTPVKTEKKDITEYVEEDFPENEAETEIEEIPDEVIKEKRGEYEVYAIKHKTRPS